MEIRGIYLKATRIRITNNSTYKLRALQSKTGLTPNILLRIGFGLSLRDTSSIDPAKYPEDGMEINRYTLTGEYDIAFVALLNIWLANNNIQINDTNLNGYFRAHINRGAILMSNKLKSLTDLAFLE
ncbi:MAG: DNA sulfur modification protein DndE [Planctomycetes bacterium]|nr:DNA sulfur modification protein DndE [Planctomycetota bacterium]